MRLRSGDIAVLTLAAVALAPASAVAAKGPSAVPSKPVATAGKKLKLVARGTGSTAFVLSADGRRGRGDVVLGSRTLRRTRTTLTLRVPARTALGAYRLLACSPAKSSNCRASKGRLALTARPRPARVRPSAAPARAASAEVGRGGGSLSATGADGTTYTLTIPEGALLDTTSVSLTPLAAVRGMPMGARGARAVQIGPAGRELLKPATLAIAPPKLPSSAALTAFGFDANGRQLHLTPVERAGSEARISVFELDGAGIASAAAAARYLFSRSRMPTSLVHQLEQVAAAPRAPKRARGSQAMPSDALGAQAFALAVSIQGLALSGAIDDAVYQYVVWQSLAVMPEAVSWRALITAGFQGGFTREIGDARARCLGSREIGQMGRLLRYRDYLYAALITLPLQSLRTDIDQALERCLRFELVYEATIGGANGYGESVDARVASTIPIRMLIAGDTDRFTGQAALVLNSYATGPATCYTHTWAVSPVDPFAIREMSVGILRERGAESLPANIRMRFNLGSLDEQVTHTCPEQSDTYTDQQHAYDGVAAELLGGAAGGDLELSWMSAPSGGDYSSQSFTRSATGQDGGSYTGTFTFRLRHTPG